MSKYSEFCLIPNLDDKEIRNITFKNENIFSKFNKLSVHIKTLSNKYINGEISLYPF